MRPLQTTRAAAQLYVGNLALLTTHQADAAYWHEWDVFGVPGGLPLFLVFNLGAVAPGSLGLLLCIFATSLAQLLRLPAAPGADAS